MKRALVIRLFLLCFVIVVSACDGLGYALETSLEYGQEYGQESNPESAESLPQTAEIALPVNLDLSLDLNLDSNTEPSYSLTIYETGMYKVGADIEAGVYMAVNDGSSVSKVVVKDSAEPNEAKPNIIITARYLPERRAFESRDAYAEAIRRGGGVPILPSNDAELAKILREDTAEDLIGYAQMLAERYDGLLLSGGGDVAAHLFNQAHHPASNPPDVILDMAEIALCRAFIALGKPVLGICRGMQVLNIAMGGELIQDIPDLLNIPSRVHNNSQTRHTLKVRSGTWLYDLFGSEVRVNSTHHQCVDGVASGFTVVAQIGPVIEAMEWGNFLGVQFHPERMLNEGMLPLFEDFVKRCSYSQIEINIFTSHTIIELKEGQYIDVLGANLQNIQSTLDMFDASFKTRGFYSEGVYLVGFHLPEGEYKLSSKGDAEFASFLIYENAALDSLLYSGSISPKGQNITLRKGQFIRLIYASMAPTCNLAAEFPSHY
jgi:putative glutamine amidotransferase